MIVTHVGALVFLPHTVMWFHFSCVYTHILTVVGTYQYPEGCVFFYQHCRKIPGVFYHYCIVCAAHLGVYILLLCVFVIIVNTQYGIVSAFHFSPAIDLPENPFLEWNFYCGKTQAISVT